MVGKLVLTFAFLWAPALSQIMRRAKPRQRDVGSKQLHAALHQALAGVPSERLLHIEEVLRPSYEAFPKDARGQLPPHQVLPTLVRSYFVKEHGWLLRGLEVPGTPIIAPGETPESAHDNSGSGEVYQTHILADKAPELAAALKQVTLAPTSHAAGLSLSDVVNAIAVLEGLLLGESLPLLRASYFLNGFNASAMFGRLPLLEESALHQVLQSYLLLYRHGLPRNLTDTTGHLRMKARAQSSADWQSVVDFEMQAVKDAVQDTSKIGWDAAQGAVLKVAERYGRFQETECIDMKSTLKAMDPLNSGRVPLKAFHGEGKHAHFQFTEKEDYLRKAGILLEESGSEPYVLIANYILGPSNCIASSEYFAVCCLNECEAIMEDFEKGIQAPAAPAAQLVSIAEEVRSKRQPESSGQALPEGLTKELTALQDISGAVILHTSAFRSWLHHVFPAECPRPTAQESQAEEAELAEAREWLKVDEASRKTWKPLVLGPSQCTRVPDWQAASESSGAAPVVEI